MLRVTLFLPSLEGGGAERNAVTLASYLDQGKVAPSFFLGKKEGMFIPDIPSSVPVAQAGGIGLLRTFFSVRQYLKKGNAEVFVSTFPRFNLANVLAWKWAGRRAKLVLVEQTIPSKLSGTARSAWHSLVARTVLPWLMRSLYPKADALVAVSHAVKKDLTETIGVRKEVTVIYNPVIDEGIDRQMAQPCSHPWFAKGQPQVVVAAGRLVKAKDYPLLLHAFSLVAQESDARLAILGEGEEELAIRKLAKKEGIASRVCFLGFQENPYPFFKAASLFVSSSRREGFSNALVEAMYCGAPAVATDAEGPEEIISHEENGLLVPVGDARALADAMIRVLHDRALAKKLSAAGRTRAAQFTVQASCRAYQELFLSIVHRPTD